MGALQMNEDYDGFAGSPSTDGVEVALLVVVIIIVCVFVVAALP